MTMLKTEMLHRQEKLRRWFFFLKLLILICLILFQTQYQPLLEEWKIQFSIISGLIFYLTAVLLVSMGRLIMVYVYVRQKKRKSDFKDNFVLGINRIASFLSNLFLFFAVLMAFGVQVDKFFTSITIVAAAIAIISKDYITNLINGLILMFSDQLSLNDHIKVGEHFGKIIDINFMNIVIETETGDSVLIPNNALLTHQVINYSAESLRKFSLILEMPLQFKKPLTEIEVDLKQSLEAYSSKIKSDTLLIQVSDIKKDGLSFLIKFELYKYDSALIKELQSLIRAKFNSWV